MNRLLRWTAAVGLLCVLAVPVVINGRPRPRVTQDAYQRIENKMSAAEIELILGRSDGAETSRGRGTKESTDGQPWRSAEGVMYWVPTFEPNEDEPDRATIKEEQWLGEDVAISIGFDTANRVVSKHLWRPIGVRQTTVLHTLRRWLRA